MRIPGELSVIAEWCCCVFYTSLQNHKYGGKKTAVISFVFLIILLQLQQVPLSYGDSIYELDIFILLMITIIPVLIFKLIPMLIFIGIVIKGKWKTTFFVFAQAFAAAEFLAAISWGTYEILSAKADIDALWFRILIIILQLALYFYILHMFCSKMNLKQNADEVDGKMAALGVTVSYICFWIGNLWNWNLYLLQPQQEKNLFSNTSYFVCGTVYFCGVLVLFLMQHSIVEMKMSKEMQVVKDMLNLRYQQYLDYMQNSEYISRQCHDLKYQIAGMRAAPGSEVWTEYLDELEGAVRKYQTWNVSGNNVLDAIMTQKKQYCIRHEIQLTCKSDGRDFNFLFIKDICTIFGNILDNAIEAVSTLEDMDSRVIHGEIARKNEFLLVKFENCYNGTVEIMDQKLPHTTKNDKENHGYGLMSVQRTVEKYNGSMSLQTENGWFVIKILIPVP